MFNTGDGNWSITVLESYLHKSLIPTMGLSHFQVAKRTRFPSHLDQGNTLHPQPFPVTYVFFYDI